MATDGTLRILIGLSIVVAIVMLALWSKLTPIYLVMFVAALAFMLAWIAKILGRE